ncbi:adenosylcobinamide-GDP ribazoletransferase [Candidatus Desantisbacteria bacterium]|nr:adenosylcobinamide-GDP ribazoletransferase [Candidatus Desantisbacteria bacterium]
MTLFLIAFQFLTILPIKIKSELKDADFGKSIIYFPLVGLAIGALLASITLFSNFLPNMVMAAIIILLSVIITGAIHLDGFIDTCDGLYGFRTKERSLEIMRDSHVGAMGIIGIVVLMLIKFSILVSYLPLNLWKYLILMTTFARWTQVLSCFTSDYARKDGKGKNFIKYCGKKEFLIGTVFTFAIFLLLKGIWGIILLSLSTIFILLIITYIKKKINGMTGDTIGAVSEMAEVVILLIGLILRK